MGPELMLIATAGQAIMGGIAGASQANAEKERAEINAYIGRTRAIQTGNVARSNLESEIASMRSVFGANNQPMDSASFDLMSRVRDVRRRERRINVSNEMQASSDFKMEAANAGQRATASLMMGFGKALPSLFDLAAL